MTPAILTAEECEALEAERAPIDTPESFRSRALATIAALRAEVAKREAMREVCYSRWQLAEDKLSTVKAELRIAQRGRDASIELAESRGANANGLAQKLAAAIARSERYRHYYVAAEAESIARHVVHEWTDDYPENAEEEARREEAQTEYTAAVGSLMRARAAL